MVENNTFKECAWCGATYETDTRDRLPYDKTTKETLKSLKRIVKFKMGSCKTCVPISALEDVHKDWAMIKHFHRKGKLE